MPARSGPTVLRSLVRSLAIALAWLLVPTMAAAATKVDDSYELKLAAGAAASDELRVKVPDDQADPDVDWQVQVTGADGGGCDQFGLALLDGTGAAGQAIDGARVVDGRLPLALRVAATAAGGPLAPGDYRCALHLARNDFAKDVVVKLEVTEAPRTLAPPTSAAPPTTTAAPATTRPAATTTSATEAPTTSGPTTTTLVVAAPVAAPGGDGGGPALGGKGPVVGAMLAVAVALLLLGGGMLATSGRSPRRIAPPPGPPGAGR